MPRKPRYMLPDGISHVMARGNRRQPIFADALDRQRFIALAAQAIERSGIRCHAFCLMTNHYHLVIEGERDQLSDAMWLLNGHFAQAFNRRHNLSGHLFERRFQAVHVLSQWHALELTRYIVLNPRRARLCVRIEDWPWSSYLATAGLVPRPRFLTTEWILGLFGDHPEKAQALYRVFVAEGLWARPRAA